MAYQVLQALGANLEETRAPEDGDSTIHFSGQGRIEAISEGAVINLSNPDARKRGSGDLGNNANSQPCRINEIRTAMSNMSVPGHWPPEPCVIWHSAPIRCSGSRSGSNWGGRRPLGLHRLAGGTDPTSADFPEPFGRGWLSIRLRQGDGS